MLMANPPHPGEILREDFLKELNISVTELAKRLNITRYIISNIINEKAGISPEMSLKLSKAFNTEPDMWIKLQVQYDLAKASEKINLDDIEVIYKAS